MSFDHLNSQPLGFGVGHFQTSFGLGDELGEPLPPPYVPVPPEVIYPGGEGFAFAFDAPRICSIILEEEGPFDCQVPIGTLYGDTPRILGRLLLEVETRRQVQLGVDKTAPAAPMGRLEAAERSSARPVGTVASRPRTGTVRRVSEPEEAPEPGPGTVLGGSPKVTGKK